MDSIRGSMQFGYHLQIAFGRARNLNLFSCMHNTAVYIQPAFCRRFAIAKHPLYRVQVLQSQNILQMIQLTHAIQMVDVFVNRSVSVRRVSSTNSLNMGLPII